MIFDKEIKINVILLSYLKYNQDNDTSYATSNGITNKNELKQKSLPERIPIFGLILGAISVFLSSVQMLIIKSLVDINPIFVLIVRSTFQFTGYFLYAMIKKHRLFGIKGSEAYLLLRCISGVIFYVMYYLAIRMMPISDFATINASMSVVVTIFAYFILKEKINIVMISTAVLVLIGVTFVANPQFLFGTNSDITYENQTLGVIFAVIDVIFGSLTLTCMRKLREIPVAINGVWLAFCLIITGFVMLYFMDALIWPKGWFTWALLVTVGSFGLCEQVLLILAFRYESAGPVSVTITLSIVFSYIWSIAIFNDIIKWTSLVGSVIISSSVFILGVYKWKLEKSKKSTPELNKT